MKRKARFIENLLLTLLLLGGMLAIYLYAGRQEQLSAAENTASEHETEPAAEIIVPEISGDGRLRAAVLSAFSEAGYAVLEHEMNELELLNAENLCAARVLLSLQGERVSGLTLRIPLPQKPETQKEPTLIEQALLERYDAEAERLRVLFPNLLDAALFAIDPYETVPLTARLYWHDLLLDAVEGDRTASDSSQPIRMKLYESSEADARYLCLSLELKG